MVKKVVFVLSLFLLVDRVMYYKLGQGFRQGAQASLSAACITSYDEQQQILKKRRVRERIALYTKRLFQENKIHYIS